MTPWRQKTLNSEVPYDTWREFKERALGRYGLGAYGLGRYGLGTHDLVPSLWLGNLWLVTL